MILLTLAGMVLGVVLIVALLVWLGMFLLRYRGHGRKVAKIAGLIYLLVCPLVVFCLFPLLMAQMIANAGTRPMDLALQMDPGVAGCDFETVEFTAADAARPDGRTESARRVSAFAGCESR